MGKWARKEDESKYKLSEESAEEAVREILDFYEIDIKEGDDPEQEKIINSYLDVVVKAYRLGGLENKRDETLGFCVIQHLKNGDTLTYREIGGKDRITMEGFDNSRVYSRAYALLGKLCGLGDDVIKKLKGRDWKNAEALAMVFFLY
jgi:hypothetical protein